MRKKVVLILLVFLCVGTWKKSEDDKIEGKVDRTQTNPPFLMVTLFGGISTRTLQIVRNWSNNSL